jgi:hypothetical protein
MWLSGCRFPNYAKKPANATISNDCVDFGKLPAMCRAMKKAPVLRFELGQGLVRLLAGLGCTRPSPATLSVTSAFRPSWAGGIVSSKKLTRDFVPL